MGTPWSERIQTLAYSIVLQLWVRLWQAAFSLPKALLQALQDLWGKNNNKQNQVWLYPSGLSTPWVLVSWKSLYILHWRKICICHPGDKKLLLKPFNETISYAATSGCYTLEWNYHDCEILDNCALEWTQPLFSGLRLSGDIISACIPLPTCLWILMLFTKRLSG